MRWGFLSVHRQCAGVAARATCGGLQHWRRSRQWRLVSAGCVDRKCTHSYIRSGAMYASSTAHSPADAEIKLLRTFTSALSPVQSPLQPLHARTRSLKLRPTWLTQAPPSLSSTFTASSVRPLASAVPCNRPTGCRPASGAPRVGQLPHDHQYASLPQPVSGAARPTVGCWLFEHVSCAAGGPGASSA